MSSTEHIKKLFIMPGCFLKKFASRVFVRGRGCPKSIHPGTFLKVKRKGSAEDFTRLKIPRRVFFRGKDNLKVFIIALPKTAFAGAR